MPDPIRELVAILQAALTLLQQHHPTEPGVRSLTTRFEAWERRQKPGPPGETHLAFATILSNRTKRGLVEMTVNQELVQMDVAKARYVAGMLLGAIEAAISDELIYTFLTTKVGLDDHAATRALWDFRTLRQGSPSAVNPN
ncbi:MAG: hypothetical protein EHM24_19680 [Acidobacteria bacterium]|nr:MAG: hypothetical protein EHM24_19680 [Acidobacteriota bacterium]